MEGLSFDEFCAVVAYNRSHGVLSNVTADTTVVPVTVTAMEDATTVTAMENATNVTTLVWFAESFETWFEISIIPSLCILAIIFSILLFIFLMLDKAMRKTTHAIFSMLIVWQLLYVISLLIFLELKTTGGLGHQLEVLAYVTTINNVALCVMTWTVAALVHDAFTATRYFYRSIRLTTMLAVRGHMFLIFLVTVVLHIPYLPPVRALLYAMDPWHFRPCLLPVAELWQGHWDRDFNSDFYYIIYFYLLFVIVGLAVPFLLVLCRDKDIIDLLHWFRSEGDMPREALNAANTAMSLSVLANVFLICFSSKIVILGFGLFQHALNFIGEENAFLHVLNTLSNMLLVGWVCATLPVMVCYNPRMQWMFMHYPLLRVRRKAKRTVQTQLTRIRSHRHASDSRDDTMTTTSVI